MKLRHVRTVAVCALVLVTLTGARGSKSGGGCDDDSGSGSHSSSGGSYGDSGSSSSGGSSGSGGTSGSRNSALRDITIDTCGFDASGKNMTATLRVDNTAGSLDYEYDITVVFKETSGVTAGTARVDDFPVTSGRTGTTEATTPYTGTGDGSEVTKCEVRRASRSSV